MPEDRLRRLGDGEAPHPDPEPDVQGRRADRRRHPRQPRRGRGRDKPGREADDERVYFNAVGLAFVDVAIALAMYRRAVEAGKGRQLTMQETMIFDHPDLATYVRW